MCTCSLSRAWLLFCHKMDNSRLRNFSWFMMIKNKNGNNERNHIENSGYPIALGTIYTGKNMDYCSNIQQTTWKCWTINHIDWWQLTVAGDCKDHTLKYATIIWVYNCYLQVCTLYSSYVNIRQHFYKCLRYIKEHNKIYINKHMHRKILWYDSNFGHACHKVNELHSLDPWTFLKMQPHELQKSSFSNEILILWLDSKAFYSLVSWLACF